MKPPKKKRFLVLRQKATQIFAVKFPKRSYRSFSVYLVWHFSQTSVLFICDNEMYRT